MPFPASEALRLLLQACQQQRLAHAYLVTGPEGAGKRALVEQLAAHLFQCPPEGVPTHSDFHSIAPESKSRRLLIDQVRELEQRIQMRSLTGGRKVAVLHDAERLTPQAANAFLKTLEEPPPDTHLFLLSAQPSQMLETILSRCVEVALQPPPTRNRSAAELELIALLGAFHTSRKPSLASGLWLAQQFQALLAQTKETLQSELEAECKAEAQRYKQTADPKWLEQREDLYAARIETAYLAARSRLLEILEAFWTDVLLLQSEQPARHLPECSAHGLLLAQTLSRPEILRRIEAVTRLREHLHFSGVNEALALEYALVEGFAPLQAS
ncbi:MAG: hypothetical protein RLZZ244_2907 [Verrucomicrobiota bacterium]|jgi:DNA polymerase-3 subunit delta'